MAETETTAATSTDLEPASPAALEAGPADGGHDAHAGDDHGHHPTPVQYVGIAILLAVVTGVEVGIYYIEMSDYLLVAILLGLAAIKFATVAAYFMHLKFDSRVLRRLFVTGIILAAIIYAIALFTMDILVR